MTSLRFVVAILAGCWLTASRRRRRRSYHLGFPICVGARVDDIMATAILLLMALPGIETKLALRSMRMFAEDVAPAMAAPAAEARTAE